MIVATIDKEPFLNFLLHVARLILNNEIDIERNGRTDSIVMELANALHIIIYENLHIISPRDDLAGSRATFPDLHRCSNAYQYIAVPFIKIRKLSLAVFNTRNATINYATLIRRVHDEYDNGIYIGGSNTQQTTSDKNINRKINEYNEIKDKLIGDHYSRDRYSRFTYHNLIDSDIRAIFDIYEFIREQLTINGQSRHELNEIHAKMIQSTTDKKPFFDLLLYAAHLILRNTINIKRTFNSDNMIHRMKKCLHIIIIENLKIINSHDYEENSSSYKSLMTTYGKLNILTKYMYKKAISRYDYDTLLRIVQNEFYS